MLRSVRYICNGVWLVERLQWVSMSAGLQHSSCFNTSHSFIQAVIVLTISLVAAEKAMGTSITLITSYILLSPVIISYLYSGRTRVAFGAVPCGFKAGYAILV